MITQTINTNLDFANVVSRIQKITTRTSSLGAKTFFLFEGTLSDDSFVLYPLTNYHQRYLLRPEIQGSLISVNGYTQIKFKYTLSKSMKALFIVAALFNLIIIILGMAPFDSVFMIAFLLLTICSFAFFYLIKVSQSHTIFKNILS